MTREPVDDNQSSGPRVVSYDATETVESDAPYVVLDVRESSEFAKYRIMRGMSDIRYY